MQAASRKNCRGNILTLSAMLMVFMMALLAFALDLGVLFVARDELQRSADAAAIAGAWELMDLELAGSPSSAELLEANAKSKAIQFASLNPVLNSAPSLAGDDVSIGYLANPSDPSEAMATTGYTSPNAVWVRVQRSESQNGKVPFFFAQLLGLDGMVTQADATAALVSSFSGFQAPPDGGNLDLLPFALDSDTWTDRMNGIGTDDWRWNANLGQVEAGADGILEVNLYPQGTGSPGNRGTVDIGSSNNSTADIARQILNGVSPADLDHHGGKLELDSNGELSLNGDTGISAGVKDELETIKGDPRIVPVFTQVTGPGNNAQYTIVQFVGIRIMEVKLTGKGSSKRVIIQPATVTVRGGIPSTTPGTTQFVYSPAWLIR